MQHTEHFRQNCELEENYKTVTFCIGHCRTVNKSNLTVNEAKCLGSCGCS